MNLFRQDVFAAQDMGTEAVRILSRGGTAGKILASLSGGIYFLTDDQEIFWVCADPAPLHRRCVRTGALPERRPGRTGQRFRTEPLLLVGDSFSVDLSGAKEWRPPFLFPKPPRPLASVRKRCEQLCRFFQCLNPGDGLGPLIPSLWDADKEGSRICRTSGVFSKLSSAIFEIAKACRRRDLSGVLEKGEGLIGLGPGLTPSGDDFMGGLFFSAFFLKKYYPEGLSWDPNRLKGFLAGTQSRTHPLSHVLLSDFASGHAPAPLGEVMEYLLQGRDFAKAASAAVQLLRFGHTTGGDMLAGLMTGMLLVSNQGIKVPP